MELKRNWYKALSVMLSLYALLVGILLAVAAVNIYREGTAAENVLGAGVYAQPVYSPEIVAQHFEPISGLVCGFLMFTLLMLILRLFVPEAKKQACVQTLPLVRMLEARLDKSKLDTPEGAEVLRERSYRKKILIGQWLVNIICIFFAGLWLLKPDSFASTELESVMRNLSANVFPWIAVSAAADFIAARLNTRSAARELSSLRKILVPGTGVELKPVSTKRKALTIIAYIFALGFILLGVYNQSMRDVFVKAVNICTECVGLG